MRHDKDDVALAPEVRAWLVEVEPGERGRLLRAIRAELRLSDPRTIIVSEDPDVFMRLVLGYEVRYRELREWEKKERGLSAQYIVLDVIKITGPPL